jgi:hypothetical protein
MAAGDIPADVQAFLRDHIHAYEQLEAAVRCHREPARWWTEETLAEALRIGLESAAEALATLAAAGIVERADAPGATAQYRAGRTCAPIVARLAELYETDRLQIIRLMNENAVHRVRTNAMRAFADAFVFRKGGKHG